MEYLTTIETGRGKVPAWCQLFLVAILVALVGGAFGLKTGPNPLPVGKPFPRPESTSVSPYRAPSRGPLRALPAPPDA